MQLQAGNAKYTARVMTTSPGVDLALLQVYGPNPNQVTLRLGSNSDARTGEEVIAISHLLPDMRMLTTMHSAITPETRRIWDNYNGFFNNISWSQRRLMPEIRGGRFAGVAYNAIDVKSFPFQKQKRDHLLFLARMSSEKGPTLAIEVARRTGRRLLMAGKRSEESAGMGVPYPDVPIPAAACN